MGELILVRHGQANSGAQTEEDYDRLSDLGHEQAGWLGDWFRVHEPGFDRVISGTMRRHVETATSMGFPPEAQDPGLNEVAYFPLAEEMAADHGLPIPQSAEEFDDHVVPTFTAWQNEKISGAEPFATFESRIQTAVQAATVTKQRVLCVTSGGVISMVMRHTLGLDIAKTAKLMLPIFNSSVHRFIVSPTGLQVQAFNAVPHLDPPGRRASRTYL